MARSDSNSNERVSSRDAGSGVVRLLLVEDSIAQARLIREKLSEAAGDRIQVFHARRLAEAHSIIDSSALIDIILLDVFLPDSQGIGTLSSMAGAHPEIPIIVITHDESLAEEAIRGNAQDYWVKKKLDGETMARGVRFAIERARLRRALQASEQRYRETVERLTELNAHLQDIATHDPLTRLLNHRGLELALQRAVESGTPHTAILVECNELTQVQREHGARGGNILLLELTERLGEILAPDNIVGSFDGLFLILCPNSHLPGAQSLARKLTQGIEAHDASIQGEHVPISVSVGACEIPLVGASLDQLLELCRLSVRKAKLLEDGAIERPGHEVLRDAKLADLLTKLCRRETYHVVGQVIIALDDERVVGREFLARTGIEGYELPTDFFALAQENGITNRVDLCCLEACLAAARNTASRMRIHVNVYPETLTKTPFESLVRMFPKNMEPGDFCLELSRQALIGDLDALAERTAALREAGFQIALNEVGFGQASLELFVLLAPDVVKLDPRVFTSLRRNPGRLSAVRRLVRVIDSLNAVIVAAGLETEQDIETARSLDIFYGQGFRWSRLDPA